MRSTFILLYIILILIFSACASKVSTNEKAIVFNKFPTETKLNETNYFEAENMMVNGLLLYQDSLLMLRNAANNSKWHFSVLNLNTKLFLPSVLESGRKQDQAMAFLSYGVSDQNLWVFDIIKNQILITDLDSIAHGKSKFKQNLDMPVFYYSVQLANNHELIGSGDYDDDYRLTKTNLLTGEKLKQLGSYNTDSTNHFTRGQKTAYESFLFLEPSQNKAVLAGRYSDRIQIFDLNNGSDKVIKGPENYEPEVLVLTGGDGKEISTRGQNTRYAFVSGKTTDKYIYLLYSGNNHESQHLHYGKYIYVYDWKGNPVEKITLSDYALDFVVTHDDSKIYTYNPKSKHIKSANLK